VRIYVHGYSAPVKPIEAIKSWKRPSLKRPSLSMPSVSIPSPWLVGAVLLAALWIGWAIYTASDRGADAGLGVLVAWPTLVLMAAIVVLPLAGIAYLVTRLVRDQRRPAIADGDDDSDENVTNRTFPL
jgi:hypothetical protein